MKVEVLLALLAVVILADAYFVVLNHLDSVEEIDLGDKRECWARTHRRLLLALAVSVLFATLWLLAILWGF